MNEAVHSEGEASNYTKTYLLNHPPTFIKKTVCHTVMHIMLLHAEDAMFTVQRRISKSQQLPLSLHMRKNIRNTHQIS